MPLLNKSGNLLNAPRIWLNLVSANGPLEPKSKAAVTLKKGSPMNKRLRQGLFLGYRMTIWEIAQKSNWNWIERNTNKKKLIIIKNASSTFVPNRHLKWGNDFWTRLADHS